MAIAFTSAGRDHVTDLIDGTVSAPANHYIGWGTGSTGAAVGDTALQTASAESRVTATRSQPSSNVNRFVGTITSSSSQTIAEAGVFTASTSGTMYMRATFTGIALANGDSITFTFDLTMNNATA